MNRYNILITCFVSFLFTKCGFESSNSITISSDIENVKKVILEGYNSNDSRYFESIENCYFEYFVNQELQDVNPYYDQVYFGLLIKHFQCPYTEYDFMIVKDFEDKLFYFGSPEVNSAEKVLNELQNEPSDSIQNPILNLSKEIKNKVELINQILEKNEIFKTNDGSNGKEINDKLKLALGFTLQTLSFQNEITHSAGVIPFERLSYRQISSRIKSIYNSKMVSSDIGKALDKMGKEQEYLINEILEIENLGYLNISLTYAKDTNSIVLDEIWLCDNSTRRSFQRGGIDYLPTELTEYCNK